MQIITEKDEPLSRTKFICPVCQSTINDKFSRCEEGHQFEISKGVHRLLEPKLAVRLDSYLNRFESIRSEQGWDINDSSLFASLPYIPESKALGNWKPKQYDLVEIRKHISNKRKLNILDLGAWNGWLSNQLAGDGHNLTAIDYFISEKDGLGAIQYYPNTFTAIQMDLEDTEILPNNYDLIIINRGLPYFADSHKQIQELKKHLKPGGQLFITGIAIYRNGQARMRSLQNYRNEYKEKYGTELFFRPVKGYLDQLDLMMLKKSGFQLFPYKQMWKYNFKSYLFPGFPKFYLGIFPK